MEARLITDGQVLARCRAGDESAWSELVDRCSRYVFAICTRAYRLSHSDAEDVFQEAFTRLYRNVDRLRDDEAVLPWMGQTTRRLCVDRLRHATRESVSPGELPEQAADDHELERLEQALVVRAAMASLPAACQDILDRFFAREESYRDISAATGIPSGTIASRISRCLARLRETV